MRPARPPEFVLDPRLRADTHPVIDLPLSHVLLMDDSRFGWLILVPRRPDLVEIADLDAPAQAQLWSEVNQVAAALARVSPCDKLNIAALGNIVRQLHVHVVARRVDDAAWPAPVWGHGQPVRYTPGEREDRCRQLCRQLATVD